MPIAIRPVILEHAAIDWVSHEKAAFLPGQKLTIERFGVIILDLLARGGAVWQLVGLITRRSQVQILPPQPVLCRFGM